MLNCWLRKKSANIRIAGSSGEIISRYQLLDAKRIENSDSNFIIVSYSVIYVDKKDRYVHEISQRSSNLPDNLLEMINNVEGNRFWIEDVKAINTIGNTVGLLSAKYKIK